MGISMSDIIAALETAFRAKGEGRTEMPPKPGSTPAAATTSSTPCRPTSRTCKSVGLKWVSGFPENYKRGLPYITGLLIYNDVETGLPLAVMDCVWITAKRTGAASAVAARRLARPESSVMGMLGCGVQGQSHAEAFTETLPAETILAYDKDAESARRYAAAMTRQLEVEVVAVKTPREAVTRLRHRGDRRTDPAKCPTPPFRRAGSTRARLPRSWTTTPTGAARPWPRPPSSAPTTSPSSSSTSPWATSRTYRRSTPTSGSWSPARRRAAKTPVERTMTANLGLAIDDMAVAPLIFARAKEKGHRHLAASMNQAAERRPDSYPYRV